MSIQKTIFIAIVCSTFFFIGCKKNTDQSSIPAFQSYLRFKLDNVQTECTAKISATYFPPSVTPDTAITIAGSWNGGDIAFAVSAAQLLTPATYIFNVAKSHSGTVWTKNPAARYVAGKDLYLNVYAGSGQVTITDISSNFAKGTFEFITGTDPGTGTFKTVSSGEFYIKRG